MLLRFLWNNFLGVLDLFNEKKWGWEIYLNGVYNTKAWELKYHTMFGIPYTSGFDQK